MADVELVIAIEEHFQIKIADPEAEKTHTVSELVQLVSNKVGRPINVRGYQCSRVFTIVK